MEKRQYDYDIRAKSFDFTVRIMRFFRELYNDRYYRFMLDQLHRSVSSVSANIEEAQNSNSNRELSRYYSIALKSGRETLHWLKLIRETNEKYRDGIDGMIPEMEKIARILGSCIIRLRKQG